MLQILKMDLIATCVALTGLFTLHHFVTLNPTPAPAPTVIAPVQPLPQVAAKAPVPVVKKLRHPLTMLSGMASFYSDLFDGRKTASGETFTQEALTACHRTLPFGTMVKVIDVRSGKSVIVRINDRGLMSPDRVIDLSSGAARDLGILHAGVAKVRLEILKSVTPETPL